MQSLICVCGAGSMGSGIAQLTAQSGFQTLLYDVNEKTLDAARQHIYHTLDTLVEKNKITDGSRQGIIQQLHFTSAFSDCRSPFVIEAIHESMEAKRELLCRLAELNGPDTILASNTSSLSVTELARHIAQPQRVVGMHFFNPAPLMKLVEVVHTPFTSEATLASTRALARQLGKTPVSCADAPGFIVNHVARPYYLEALRMLEAGNVAAETIDTLLENTGFRMGPFRLMDLIGNDINYAVTRSVYEAMGKPGRLAPSPIQQKKVEDREWGKKSGKGFYDYS